MVWRRIGLDEFNEFETYPRGRNKAKYDIFFSDNDDDNNCINTVMIKWLKMAYKISWDVARYRSIPGEIDQHHACW